MGSQLDNILEKALDLDINTRASLIQKLIDSLDDGTLESEWMNLAEKRLSELRNGRVKSISWDSIKSRVEEG